MIRKNIIYVSNGCDSYYEVDLKLREINNQEENNYYSLVQIDKLENIKRKQNFLLLLTMDDLYECFPDIIDIYKPNVYEIDRYLRKLFKNFQYVIIISIEEFDYGHIPFSNIYVEYANKYLNTNEGINTLINKLNEESNSKKELKDSRIKKQNIKRLKNYIDKSQKEFINTKEIIDNLNVNKKWIQRYMKDMNNLYQNIGYNKSKRVWYVVKNNFKNEI